MEISKQPSLMLGPKVALWKLDWASKANFHIAHWMQTDWFGEVLKPLSQCSSFLSTSRYSEGYGKITWSPTQPQNPPPTSCPARKKNCDKVPHTCGSGQSTGLTRDQCQEKELLPTLSKWPGIRGWVSLRTRVEWLAHFTQKRKERKKIKKKK